jgi:hypothetical protein
MYDVIAGSTSLRVVRAIPHFPLQQHAFPGQGLAAL